MMYGRAPTGAGYRPARDLFPNLGTGFSTFEMTIVSRDELDHYNQASTAAVETAEGIQPVKKMDGLKVLGLIAVAVVVLVLLGKSKGA